MPGAARRRLGRILCGLLVLAAAWPVAAAAQPGAPQTRQLPLFDLAAASHSLQVEVREARYGPGSVYDLATLPAQLATMLPGEPEAVVLSYMQEVLSGRTGGLSRFYAPGAFDARQARQTAQLYGAMLGAGSRRYERLALERLWHFGPFRLVLLRAEGSGGSRRFSISLERVGEVHVRRDDWGEWQPVHMIFWYMATNAHEGLEAGHAPREMPISVTFRPASGPTLALSFDGRLHPTAEDWAPVSLDASPEEPGGFLRYAAAVAAELDAAAFVDLWHGEEQTKMASAYERETGSVRGLRSRWAEIRAVKDVLTLDLGGYAVHYFLESGGAGRLEAVVLKRAAGGYWLTGDLYANIDQLVRSELMKTQIFQLAATGP